MTLLTLCKNITGSNCPLLPAEHPMTTRLICPEYSKSTQDIKTYPLLKQDQLFALCWNIRKDQGVFATLRPSPMPFRSHHIIHTNGSEKTQLHTHDYLELAYVVEGDFHQKILGKDVVFEQGELCLIDKNCLHQDYLLNQSATILFLGISNEMFDEIIDENNTSEKIVSFLQSALLKQKDLQQYLHFRPKTNYSSNMEDCLQTLLSELCRNDAGSRYICKGLLIRLFRLLSTEYEFSLSKEQQKTMSWIIFEEVSEYIQTHYVDVTIQDLVKIFHFQEDYFNRLIKKKTGLTYSGFVQQIRLSKAAAFLAGTDYSVDEITEKVGYHNKGYFYKIFQEKYGMTPKQYRKQKYLI